MIKKGALLLLIIGVLIFARSAEGSIKAQTLPQAKIAYVISGNIHLINTDGTGHIVLTNDATLPENLYPPSSQITIKYTPPNWSKDGRYLAFLRYQHDYTAGGVNSDFSFRVYDTQTNQTKKLTLPAGPVLYYNWKDAENVYVVFTLGTVANCTEIGTGYRIAELNVRTDTQNIIKEFPDGQAIFDVMGSSNPNLVAYYRKTFASCEGRGDLCAYNISSGKEVCSNLGSNPTSWINDGQSLITDNCSASWGIDSSCPAGQGLSVFNALTGEQRDLEQPPNHVIFTNPIGLPNGGFAFIYSGYRASDYPGGMPNLVNRFLWVSPSLNPYDGGAVDQGDIFLTDQASSTDSNFIVYVKGEEIWISSTSKPYQPFKLTNGWSPVWQPGKPATPAVLLVHGCGGNAETWSPWIEEKTFVSLLEFLPFTETVLYEGKNESIFPGARVFILDYTNVPNRLEDLSLAIPEALDKIKELTGDSKVDIVTHSMGAILVRFYLEDQLSEAASARRDVDKLLMLAPPNKGAWAVNYLSSRIIRLTPNVGIPLDLACEQVKEIGPKSDTIKMLNSHTLLGSVSYYEVAAGSRFYYLFVGKTDPWIATRDAKLPANVLPSDADYVYREVWAAHSTNVKLEIATSYLGEPIIGIIVHSDTLELVRKFYRR